ncbi:MAG: 4Fe-4S binding protein [Methanosarcinales archaeon]|nr:4Fe-4S binding protein [Methanosarcinales archaeon]
MTKKNDEPLHIFSSWCKQCGICIAICPKKVLEKGNDGYPYAARPEDCILCGMCDAHCPDYAITLQAKHEVKEEGEHE